MAPTSRITARALGKMPTTSVRRLTLLVQAFLRVVGPDLAPVVLWKRQIGQHLVLGLIQELGDTWEASTQLVGDAAPLFTSGGGIRVDEHRADGGGDHLLRPFGYQAEGVSHEMGPTALPAGSLEYGGDGAFESLVAVADHQLHTGQTT